MKILKLLLKYIKTRPCNMIKCYEKPVLFEGKRSLIFNKTSGLLKLLKDTYMPAFN